MKKEKKNLMQKTTNNLNLVLECIMPPEYWLLAISAIFILLILSITGRSTEHQFIIFAMILVIIILPSILVLMAFYKSKKLSRPNTFLYCFHSIIRPNHVWIIQKTFIFPKPKNKCPKDVFKRELPILLEEIQNSNDITYLMSTHSIIKKALKKNFPDSLYEYTHKGCLGRIRHKLCNKYCKKTCSNREKCNINNKKQKEAFWSIKIKR